MTKRSSREKRPATRKAKIVKPRRRPRAVAEAATDEATPGLTILRDRAEPHGPSVLEAPFRLAVWLRRAEDWFRRHF